MDKDTQKYSTPDKRGGFSHNYPLRPNTLPIIDGSGNCAHLFSSQSQSFEKDKFCSEINSGNSFGEYILGDPMLVDQTILQRTCHHLRPRLFSPQFEGDMHRDQHNSFPSRHFEYSREKSLQPPADATEISPAYLNISPLFPHFQQSFGNQESLSPFRLESSQMVDVSPNFRSHFDSSHFFRRMNPSPLFHPSAPHLPKDLPSTENRAFLENLKSHDSFLDVQQERETVLHMRTSKENNFDDQNSNSIANSYKLNQRRLLHQRPNEGLNKPEKSRGTIDLNKTGLEPLQMQLLSNLGPKTNFHAMKKPLNATSKSAIYSANGCSGAPSLISPLYITDTPSGKHFKGDVATVADEKDGIGLNAKTAKVREDGIEQSKLAPDLFSTVFDIEGNAAKNWLIQCSVQALDDLKAKTKKQIVEVDTILNRRKNSTDYDVKENGHIKQPMTIQTKTSENEHVEYVGKDLGKTRECVGKCDKCQRDLRRRNDSTETDHDFYCICKALTDDQMFENQDVDFLINLPANHSKQASPTEVTRKHIPDALPEKTSTIPQIMNIDCPDSDEENRELVASEFVENGASNESENRLAQKSNGKLPELSREERAIQYAMQKFQEMEQKQNGKRRKKRPSHVKRKKGVLENLSEVSDEDQETDAIEQKKKKIDGQIVDFEEKNILDNSTVNRFPTEYNFDKKRNLAKAAIASKDKPNIWENDNLSTRDLKKNLILAAHTENQFKLPKKTSLDEKDSKTQSKIDLQQKSYLLVPSYRGFKDFSPILLESRTRGRSTQADTERVGKAKFPILVVEKVGEKKNEILVRENEDLEAKIARESLLAENVYDEVDENTKAKSNVKQLSCNRMTGETVLHKAARLGYDDIVVIKIKEGADVNARDNAGWTALHEACSRGMTEVVKELLKYGADPNSCSESGIRPIHDAVDSNKIEVIRLLLSYGADASTETYSGLKILQLAHTPSTVDYLKGFAGDIQDDSVLESEEDFSKNLWNFRGSSFVLDSVTDDTNDLFSTFPDHSDRLIEFEASKVPYLPCYNLPVYGEDEHIIGFKNYYRLQDVLKITSTSRQVFLKKHKVELRKMVWTEFMQQIAESQVCLPAECTSSDDEMQLLELVHLGPFTSKKVFDLKTYAV